MVYFASADFSLAPGGDERMRRSTIRLVQSAATAAAVCVSLLGCGKHSDSSATSDANPPTAPTIVANNPTSAPSTQPSASLDIDGKPVAFPPAKLVITKKAGGLEAILCSDDPPNAIEPSYNGNSFMIEMKLDVDDPAELPTAVWEYKTEKQSPRDSTTGIFLSGARRQMQPSDVRITFEKQGDRVVATVGGKFLLFEAHDIAAPVQVVDVKGKLDAAVREQ
jgi:hypothetical protein